LLREVLASPDVELAVRLVSTFMMDPSQERW